MIILPSSASTQPTHPPDRRSSDLSCYWLNFVQILKVGSLSHLKQIPTVTLTFVHAIFVLATFVFLDPKIVATKIFGPKEFWAQNSLWINIFYNLNFFGSNVFGIIFSYQTVLWMNICFLTNLFFYAKSILQTCNRCTNFRPIWDEFKTNLQLI